MIIVLKPTSTSILVYEQMTSASPIRRGLITFTKAKSVMLHFDELNPVHTEAILFHFSVIFQYILSDSLWIGFSTDFWMHIMYPFVQYIQIVVVTFQLVTC
jgi:hypothetical protein